MLKLLASATLALGLAVPAHAASLVYDGGTLVGAKNVEIRTGFVGGVPQFVSVDLSFEDGSCASLYDGCDDPSDFVFANNGDVTTIDDDGQNILEPIREQVFDPPSGNGFDGSNVRGCTTANCTIYFAVDSSLIGFADQLVYALILTGTNIGGSNEFISKTLDTSGDNSVTYGVMSVSPPQPVPVPASALLLLSGLALLSRRRA